jgi:hypothetical protein
LPACIDWEDAVVSYGLRHHIKYARLVQRAAITPRAQGADEESQRYSMQLALSGVPYHKPKSMVGQDTIGLDLGPSTVAIVPRAGTPRLEVLCAVLAPDAQAIRRLKRQMDRRRRANNPDNYDERGRVKRHVKSRLSWKHSKRYQASRRSKATRERKLAAHRKSLHGRLVHEIVAVGTTVITEMVSHRAKPQQHGRSVGLRAPGMFIALLRCTVASMGGTLSEVSTHTTRLSQFCHGGGKSRAQAVVAALHHCACGVSAHRDLCSAFWPPIWKEQIPILRAPGTRGDLKVGSPACRQHTSTQFNMRVRGTCCLALSRIPGDGARLPKSPSLAPRSRLPLL